MRYKKIIVLSLICILCFLFVGCNSNDNDEQPIIPEFTLAGDWSGNKIVSKTTTIGCEEYETKDGGIFLGKEVNDTYRTVYLVDNIAKDLTYAYVGLVERSSRMFLGEDYTYRYVLKDYSTGNILYSDEEVIYITDGCYDNETLSYMGTYTATRYDYYYQMNYYTINGVEYSEKQVTRVWDAYFSVETNTFLGREHNFDKVILSYTINDKTYNSEEVYELQNLWSSKPSDDLFSGDEGRCYIENSSQYCYTTKEVVETYGYEYTDNTDIYAYDQVRQIFRNINGEELENINLQIGENYAQIKISSNLTYDYTQIANCTYRSQDEKKDKYYRGYYGLLNDTIYFTADEYSLDGAVWNKDKSNTKFEFQIVNNKLLYDGIVFEKETEI